MMNPNEQTYRIPFETETQLFHETQPQKQIPISLGLFGLTVSGLFGSGFFAMLMFSLHPSSLLAADLLLGSAVATLLCAAIFTYFAYATLCALSHKIFNPVHINDDRPVSRSLSV